MKARIARGVLRRDELLTRLRARVREEYTPEEVRAEGLLLARMGMLPPGTRYEETVFSLLEEQVAGFYDTTEHQLFLADWLPADMQEQTLAHEVVHALQDQHFGIGELLRARRRNADSRLALSALAEGDGIAVMIDYLARGTGQDFTTIPDLVGRIRAQASGASDQPVLSRSPRVLKETLLFPYLGGVGFVRALKLHGGWAAVDAAFRSPPDSSEQVLHPERYLTRDPPHAVRAVAPRGLEATHEEVLRDVLGEVSIRLYFEETLDEAEAARAATGWGGDEAALYVRRGAGSTPGLADVALVLRTSWDSERDAGEAEQAFSRAMARRFPRARGGRLVRCLADGTMVRIERSGREVSYVEGVPSRSR